RRARARRRSDRPVRLRRALSGRCHHRRARCAVPDLSAHPHEPLGRIAVTEAHTLTAEGLTLGYGDRTIIEALDLAVAPGKVTAIVGANGCGKSTLLRSLARLLSPASGQVVLDGKSVHSRPTKEVARVLGLLPQSPIAPEGI